MLPRLVLNLQAFYLSLEGYDYKCAVMPIHIICWMSDLIYVDSFKKTRYGISTTFQGISL